MKSKPAAHHLLSRGIFTLMLMTFFSTWAQASLCVIPAEEGTWYNYDRDTRNITRLIMDMECRDASTTTCNGNICSTTSAVKPHYFIRLFGKCYPSDCDWGRIEGQRLTGSLDGWYYFSYDQGFAKRYVYIRSYPAWPNWLRLYIYNDFTDPARTDYTIDEWMHP